MKMFKKGKKLSFGNKIEEIMKKENKINSGGNNIFFKPELGENVVRILPYMHEPEQMWPFFTVYTHWKINNENLISPKTYNKTDPFIEYASKIWQNEDISKDDRKKIFSRLSPSDSTYCPIIVRGKDETEIKMWRIPNSVRDTIFGCLRDPETEMLIDPYDGIDIILTKTQTDPKDYKTISYSLRLKRKNSAIGTEEQLEKIFNVETFPKFDEVWKLMDEDEYQKKFDAYITGSGAVNPPKKSQEQKSEPADTNQSTDKSSSIDDTMNKFKAMVDG